MNRIFYLSLVWFTAAVVSVTGQPVKEWTVQSTYDDGTAWPPIPLIPHPDPALAAQGRYLFDAVAPIGAHGSLFELWAKRQVLDPAGSGLYIEIDELLDTQEVGTWRPTVIAEIISEDPYVEGTVGSVSYVRRTRADKPFQVRLEVSGLDPSAAAAESYKRQLKFEVKKETYSLQTYVAAVGAVAADLGTWYLDNGVHVLGPYMGDSATDCGCFRIRLVRDQYDITVEQNGVDVQMPIDARELFSPRVEVWPVSEAAVTGIVANQVFVDRIPSLTVELKHLYPESGTFARIYPVGTTPSDAHIVDGTAFNYGTLYSVGSSPKHPQNHSLEISDLSDYATSDGRWTFEIVTKTRFYPAGELLFQVTFEVDRVIDTRGQINTAEKPAPSP